MAVDRRISLDIVEGLDRRDFVRRSHSTAIAADTFRSVPSALDYTPLDSCCESSSLDSDSLFLVAQS